MKTKSISFAEVLRKNTKSPRVEMTKTSMRLEEMVRKFEVDPEDDYTLYLGNFNASQRSKPSPFQMTFSRNTVQNQEEMFDSWIQKQSAIGSNKENIRNQPQRSIRNESSKSSMGVFAKNITHSKTKQDTYPSNSTASNRQKNSKPIEQTQRSFVPLNIEMVKSNGYESEQAINRVKSPKNQRKNMQAQPTPIINMDFDKPKNNVFERPGPIKVEPTFKEIKESKESQRVQNQFIKLPQKTNEYISFPKEQANQHFQAKKSKQQINDITNKYQNAEYSLEAEDDDDLLLQFPNPQFQKNEVVFDEAYTKKAQKNDEVMKKRIEDAKHMIGNYLDKFKREKQQTENEKINDIYLNNPYFESSNKVNAPNHMVGYSFSTNINGVNQSSQNQPNHHQNYIPDVVSQAASESQQPLNDSSNFKNKYLNMESYEEEVQHNQHIQNIQSVKYNGDYHQQNAFEHEQLYAIPNDTFRVQLITSKDNQNAKNQQYNSIQLSAPKEERFQNKITGSYESNLLESEGTKTKAHGKSKQKISLMSNKSRNEKSNKTSPTTTNQPEKQPDVATTDFAIDIPKQAKQSEKYFLKNIEKSYEEQHNKTEAKMFYDIKKDEEYQYNDVPRDTKQSISGSYGFASYPAQQSEKTINTNITEYIPYGQKKVDEYQVPTYANTKTTSKLDQITSDYYSTNNYTHYTPSYERRHYEAPSYGNTAKNHFVSSKTYEKMPLKVESPYIYDPPKEEPKKQHSYAAPTTYTPSSTDSYEHKYALPTSYTSNTDKEINKNYLQKLDIKESITFEESKTKQDNSNTANPLKSSNSSNYLHTFANNTKQFKTVNPVTNPRVSLKLSLKQSINVSQSEEFVFDI